MMQQQQVKQHQDDAIKQSSSSQQFHHVQSDADTCTCPIHTQDTPIFTAPLGYSFSDDVTVSQISKEAAKQIYQSHHSYMDGKSLHPAAGPHHGIYYQDTLVGAISYQAPFGKRKLHWDHNGELIPRPTTDISIDSLPEEFQPRAKEFFEPSRPSDVAKTEVYGGTKIYEISRICIGVEMPNLASCSLAESQKTFVNESAPDDTEYLLTFVRADYDASMVKALKGMGWSLTSISKPSRAGNRNHKSIRDQFKWVFMCPLETAQLAPENIQSSIDQWQNTK